MPKRKTSDTNIRVRVITYDWGPAVFSNLSAVLLLRYLVDWRFQGSTTGYLI